VWITTNTREAGVALATHQKNGLEKRGLSRQRGNYSGLYKDILRWAKKHGGRQVAKKKSVMSFAGLCRGRDFSKANEGGVVSGRKRRKCLRKKKRIFLSLLRGDGRPERRADWLGTERKKKLGREKRPYRERKRDGHQNGNRRRKKHTDVGGALASASSSSVGRKFKKEKQIKQSDRINRGKQHF